MSLSTADPQCLGFKRSRTLQRLGFMIYSPDSELKQFGRWRTQRLYEQAARGLPDRIHGSLLVALASRETNLRNIVGFDGHDRGLFQISDRYHSGWLDQSPGCASGSYVEAYDSALPPGRVPGLTRGARKAI